MSYFLLITQLYSNHPVRKYRFFSISPSVYRHVDFSTSLMFHKVVFRSIKHSAITERSCDRRNICAMRRVQFPPK